MKNRIFAKKTFTNAFVFRIYFGINVADVEFCDAVFVITNMTFCVSFHGYTILLPEEMTVQFTNVILGAHRRS